MRTSTAAGVAMMLAVLAAGCGAITIRQDLNKANKLFAAKKYDQAIPEYQKVLKSDPDHWMANYYLAMSWMAQFHPQSTHPMDAEIKKQAVASLEKLMKLEPPSPEDMDKVETYYLSLLTSAGDNEQAIAFLEKQLQKEPDNKDIMSQLAQLQAKVGNFDESLKWYEKIAEMDPKTKTNWYTVAVLCWERSNKAGHDHQLPRSGPPSSSTASSPSTRPWPSTPNTPKPSPTRTSSTARRPTRSPRRARMPRRRRRSPSRCGCATRRSSSCRRRRRKPPRLPPPPDDALKEQSCSTTCSRALRKRRRRTSSPSW